MTRVFIDPALDRQLRISRFLSFPQFAELIVQHRMQFGAVDEQTAGAYAQRWRVGRAGRVQAEDMPPACDEHTIQIESDIGALAEALFTDAQTALHVKQEIEISRTEAAHELSLGVELVVESAAGAFEIDGSRANRTIPVLVDIGRLLKGVSVASTAPAHFADLILRMVRDHVWLDVSQYHADLRETAVSP